MFYAAVRLPPRSCSLPPLPPPVGHRLRTAAAAHLAAGSPHRPPRLTRRPLSTHTLAGTPPRRRLPALLLALLLALAHLTAPAAAAGRRAVTTAAEAAAGAGNMSSAAGQVLVRPIKAVVR